MTINPFKIRGANRFAILSCDTNGYNAQGISAPELMNKLLSEIVRVRKYCVPRVITDAASGDDSEILMLLKIVEVTPHGSQ